MSKIIVPPGSVFFNNMADLAKLSPALAKPGVLRFSTTQLGSSNTSWTDSTNIDTEFAFALKRVSARLGLDSSDPANVDIADEILFNLRYGSRTIFDSDVNLSRLVSAIWINDGSVSYPQITVHDPIVFDVPYVMRAGASITVSVAVNSSLLLTADHSLSIVLEGDYIHESVEFEQVRQAFELRLKR